MEKIQASLIFEILGRPAERVKETLNTHVIKLGLEKGIKIINRKHHKPRLVENTKDLFTAFIEVDAEFDSLQNYFLAIFSYFPSHVEITSPNKISLSNIDLNELANLLVQRLYKYDAITKNTFVEKEILINKIKQFAPHLLEEKKEEKINELESQKKN